MNRRLASLLVPLLPLLLACDRNIEPFVPGEQPKQPDLSRIFPPGAERAASADRGVELPAPPPEQGGRGLDASAEAPPIRGTVTLGEGLGGAVRPGAVLFVIARTGDAGPPLAVQRIASPSFPVHFEIGPGDRMIKARPFAGELQLSARLDSDGNAVSRSAGDLQGRAPGRYAPGASDVSIVLDERL